MSEAENKVDLSGLSINELRDLKTRVVREIELRSNQEKVRARERILEIAQSVGIPLQDLLGGKSPRGARRDAGALRGKVAVRYRHPHNPDLQWTGRGRQPKWITAWLQEGGEMSDLSV